MSANDDADIDSFDKLVAWVEANTEGIRGYPDPKEAAMWFVACEMAPSFVDGMRLKDYAHIIIDGVEPLTERDADEWLREFYFDPDDGQPVYQHAALVDKLRIHYGLDKESDK